MHFTIIGVNLSTRSIFSVVFKEMLILSRYTIFFWHGVSTSLTPWLLCYFDPTIKLHEHTIIHTVSGERNTKWNTQKRQLCSYKINATAFVLKHVNKQYCILSTFREIKIPKIFFLSEIGANSSTVIPLNLLCMLKYVTSGVKKSAATCNMKMNNFFMYFMNVSQMQRSPIFYVSWTFSKL